MDSTNQYYQELENEFSNKFNIQNFNRVEMRSDTFSLPTDEMRECMKNAIVGDDVWGEDLLTIELQETAAKLFGKEKGLFLSSGTQCNLISMMIHARGYSVIIGSNSHINIYEAGGLSIIGNMFPRVVPNNPDGSMNFEDLKAQIPTADCHFAQPKLLCLELTHNVCNGRVPSLDFIKQIRAFCDEHNLKLHLDGARCLNACEVLNIEPHELAKYFDSLYLCFSKGLGSVAGSVLLGDAEFIGKAHKLRKQLGGGMRQIGILTGPALIALKNYKKTIQRDHYNARVFAEEIAKHEKVEIDLPNVQSNIIRFKVRGMNAIKICQILKEQYDVRLAADHLGIMIRGVTNHNVSHKQVLYAAESLKKVIDQLSQEQQ